MPHVIVKLWPGKSEQQKANLAEQITEAVMTTLGYGEQSVTVSMEEVTPQDWKAQVYEKTSSMGRAGSTRSPDTGCNDR